MTTEKHAVAIVTPGLAGGNTAYNGIATLILRALEQKNQLQGKENSGFFKYCGFAVGTTESALRMLASEENSTLIFITRKMAEQAETIARAYPHIRVLLFGTGPRPRINKKAEWIEKGSGLGIKGILQHF